MQVFALTTLSCLSTSLTFFSDYPCNSLARQSIQVDHMPLTALYLVDPLCVLLLCQDRTDGTSLLSCSLPLVPFLARFLLSLGTYGRLLLVRRHLTFFFRF